MARRDRVSGSGRDNSVENCLTVTRQELESCLRKIKPGITEKNIIELSDSFVFSGDKIWSYNDQISICHKINTGIIGAIKAKEFYNIISKISCESISIAQTGNTVIFRDASKEDTFELSINVVDSKEPPISVPGIESSKWMALPSDFSEAAKFCVFSASKNMAIPELTCLWVTGDKVVSCDSFRGTLWNLSADVKKDFLLPAKAAVYLDQYSPHKYMVDESWVHFINKEGTTFSCRGFGNGKYPPKIWSFFEVDGEEIELPESLAGMVDRAQVIVTEDFEVDRFVTITIEGGKLTCKGQGKLGTFKEKTNVQYKGDKIEIDVHPIFLKQIIVHLQQMVVGERLKFKADAFEHVICLTQK